MDRVLLEVWLGEGLSLEEIGRRVGKHPSTVGYWVEKHGLEAVNRERNAPRGGIGREELESLVASGASISQIAGELDRSRATVRHWLGRYGLRTCGRPRVKDVAAARASGLGRRTLICRIHGETDFWLESRGYYRCLRCRLEAVCRRRRKIKSQLVEEAGGRCCMCGYDRYVGALEFHHREPTAKSFGLAQAGITRSLEVVRAEARKCVLLCSNCHAEVEGGVRSLPA
jgi:DNA-binding CsgD family transcriptional regulator